jgi:nucleotide-binding universal stress UspA family protein
MFPVRKILYATDFSSYSNQAYFHAVALAEYHQASLTVMYVFSPGVETPTPGRGDDMEHLRDQLEQIRPRNRSIVVNHVVLEGHPADEIVRYAHEACIDLIVMGTHGRNSVTRHLMGSVAEQVMREAHCSTLVVKLPRGQSSTEKPYQAELLGCR